MDNLDDSETNAKISDSAYSNSCSNSQSRRSHSSKSTHSGSNSSGSSGYGGKPSTSGSSNTLSQPPKKDKESKKKKLSPQTEPKETDSPPVDESIGTSEPEPIFVPPQEIPSNALQKLPKIHVSRKSDDAAEDDNTQGREREYLRIYGAEYIIEGNVLDSQLLSGLNPVDSMHVVEATSVLTLPEKAVEKMDISPSEIGTSNEEATTAYKTVNTTVNYVTSRPDTSYSSDGFSCVISMHDGVVMYTTSSLSASLGFPKDLWIGRSFIDFLHPRDRNTFASQITNGVAVPKAVNGTLEKAQTINAGSTMVCRIRRYRGLTTGFGVKERVVMFMPFLLKFSFKNINDEEGKIIYLVIQATPFYSAFKVSNELVNKPNPFVIRHAADGNLDYLDPESVPYLGYLPQDVQEKDALQLYHPEDLPYLRQVYEKIVKEGSVPRSKPYRMMAQNGDYLKLETEWSSFVNPWSKKLEFVIGKHHIIEGPTNPDVFQTPSVEKNVKLTEEEKNTIHSLRDNIIHTMNEVMTKPAELAKQQMTKRCQELASIMENLMEEMPKIDDELRLEIQDPDNSYYERDSVMLGGISPHHDYDSKTSTETPLSYNQLNYNENLQRYFDSHQPYCYEDYNTTAGENVLGLKHVQPASSQCLSSMAQNTADTNEISSCESGALVVTVNNSGPQSNSLQQSKLTESLLNKSTLNRHNAEMEKELVKMHRESRTSSKGDRKASNETRQKKKEHLARCNASFQPTASPLFIKPQMQPQGIKRGSKQQDTDVNVHKHHCASPRHARRRQPTTTATTQPQPNVTTTVSSSQWPSNPVGNMNTFILGVGIPQQMSMMTSMAQMQGMPSIQGMASMQSMPSMQGIPPMPSMPSMQGMPPMQSMPSMQGIAPMQSMAPMPSMQGMPQMQGMPTITGMFPMYYAPTPSPSIGPLPSTTDQTPNPSTNATTQYGTTPVPCMMYGQPVYGQPFVYSSMNPQVSYPMPQSMVSHQSMEYTNALGLTSSNYEEACKSSLPMRPNKSVAAWREKKRAESKAASSKTDQLSGDSSNKALTRSTEGVLESATSQDVKSKATRTSDEAMDRTDGESSYSSFYSSFLKTESGSAEESGDQKKKNACGVKNSSSQDPCGSYYDNMPNQTNKVARRKMEPPWMEKVCVTSELIYKYQIHTKSVEEVLAADKQKIISMEQPFLVNEQLGQLYIDLQLEGVAAQLTLEEGITSSNSSGEETSNAGSKKKREYSKIVMIYEEDAPLPPPCPTPEATPNVPSEPTS